MREEILNILETNSKIDPAQIADRIGTSEEAVVEEMEAMEREGIFCGYHALINWDKVRDDHVTALIEVHVTPQKERGFDRLAKKIYQFPEVDSIALISGSCDFLVTIKGHTLRETATFVNEQLAVMEGVISTATHFVLKKYKDHGVIMLDEEREERIPVTL